MASSRPSRGSRHSYASDPAYADLTPLPQDDGGPNALAVIAYTDEYRETTSYLRALMAANERSERALAVTSHLIELNPAHYTVWLYRSAILETLAKDIREELKWLNGVSLRHIKNYQIWHHRQTLMERLAAEWEGKATNETPTGSGTRGTEEPHPTDGESEFLAAMLDRDAKNYHVWSYRQWLVRRFNMFDSPAEMAEVEGLLETDIRNNSAWNHRWFLSFGSSGATGNKTDASPEAVPAGVWQREMDYAKAAIRLAPQNESPWNYLRGLLRKFGRPVKDEVEFAREFVDLDDPSRTRCSFALDMLAQAYAEEGGARRQDADRALQLLGERFDPIRVNYWNWRRAKLGLHDGTGSAAAA